MPAIGNVYIPVELRTRIRVLAAKRGETMGAYVARVLSKQVSADEKKVAA